MTWNKLKIIALFTVPFLVLGVACQQQDTEPEPKKEAASLTVWHAWQGPDVEVLEWVADEYRQNYDGEVELVAVGSPQDLLSKLEEAAEGPDVLIGDHTLGDELLERGFANAYCLPGQCPECQQPDPPRWCLVATGDFSYGRIDDFLLTIGYCTQDQCPACYGDNPPRWCRFASGDLEVPGGIDVPHAAFAGRFDDGVFPYGIPIWWDVLAVAAHPSRVEEQGITMPETLESVAELARNKPDAVRFEPLEAADGHPVPFPADLGPDQQGDPNPQPNVAALVIDSSNEILAMEHAAEHQFPSLEGYRPPMVVEGAYLRSGTERRTEGLSFMYLLAYEDTQRRLFEKGKHLPAHGGVLAETAGEKLPETLVTTAKRGLLAGARGDEESGEAPQRAPQSD